jgi:hypothetical protein
MIRTADNGNYCKNYKKSLTAIILLLFIATGYTQKSGQGKIELIQQNFDQDPGWENYHNRIECSDCPTITQDFGWNPTNITGLGPGEIGGVIWQSATPATYAMPVGPFSFKDKLSASGKLVLVAPEKEAEGFYIGFFNDERQGWRVWSSFGFRMGPVKNGRSRFHLDYKTGSARGAILNPDIDITCDGSVHNWKLDYDPEATVAANWPDPRLPKWITTNSNVHEDEIYKRAVEDEPGLKREDLHNLLLQARDAGLVDHWYRKGSYHLWDIEKNAAAIKGRITFSFDDQMPVSFFLLPGHREQPSVINRFGIYNMQVYHGSITFYLSDLVVNGQKIDLSQDPHWIGKGNRVSFRQDDFHAKQNFGYSQTNWAGASAGEIGGRFWGTEVRDPWHGYYATDIGQLTLNDPLEFSGWINFTEGAVDGRMLIGYFNRQEKLAEVKGEYKGNPPHQYLGLEVMDQTQLGYSFTAVCSPRQDESFEERGPVYIPDRIKRFFSFKYDPDKGEAGRITVTLDTVSFSVDLRPGQRKIGSTFDRFGILNPRKGGKYVDVYVDELSYTARLPQGYTQVRHDQTITRVPYPEDGREYK